MTIIGHMKTPNSEGESNLPTVPRWQVAKPEDKSKLANSKARFPRTSQITSKPLQVDGNQMSHLREMAGDIQ